MKKIQLHLIALFSLCCFSQANAANIFPEDIYLTLKDSGQIAKYAGPAIWQANPVMLYNSLTSDGKRLVVSSPKQASIYVFDASSGKQLAAIPVGKASKGLKISPNDQEVYVANEGAASVSVVDLNQYQVVATISVAEMPHNIRFSDDGKIAYVTLQGGAGLGVIDTHTRQIVKVIPTPGLIGPHNLDLSKDGNTAFIRDTSSRVGVLDLPSGQMKKIIDVGQGHGGIDVSPNGKLVFTGAIADDVVTVIDANTLQIIKKIKVGFGPHGVRTSKDNRWLYVVVTADDQLYIIDTETLKVAKIFSIASFPFWIAVNGNP